MIVNTLELLSKTEEEILKFVSGENKFLPFNLRFLPIKTDDDEAGFYETETIGEQRVTGVCIFRCEEFASVGPVSCIVFGEKLEEFTFMNIRDLSWNDLERLYAHLRG